MPDGGNIDPAVLDEIKREISGFGDNVKELKTSLNKDLAEARRIAEEAKGGLSDVLTKNQVEALTNSVVEKQTALEGKVTDRLDDIEKKLNRPRMGGSDAEVNERKQMMDFHRQQLAMKGELKVGRDMSDDKLPIEEIKSYIGTMPMYLRRGENVLGANESKAMLVGSDPDGGYLVTPEISRRVLSVVYETSPMRQLANVETISTDAIEMPTDDGEAGAGWVGETEDRPETSTPQLGTQRIPVHELYAMPKATQKLLEDASVDVEGWLADKIGQKFARMEATAFVSGNGVKKPRGILTYAPVTTGGRGQVEQIASGGVGVITADAFVNMSFALKEYYTAGASWIMRRASVPALMLLKDTTGRYLWQPGLQAGAPAVLLGYPVYQAADMPAIATGALAVAFGNWKTAYTIVDRLGITTLRDPYTAKPFVLFYTRKRVGGDVTNFEAYKLMKIG